MLTHQEPSYVRLVKVEGDETKSLASVQRSLIVNFVLVVTKFILA